LDFGLPAVVSGTLILRGGNGWVTACRAVLLLIVYMISFEMFPFPRCLSSYSQFFSFSVRPFHARPEIEFVAVFLAYITSWILECGDWMSYILPPRGFLTLKDSCLDVISRFFKFYLLFLPSWLSRVPAFPPCLSCGDRRWPFAVPSVPVALSLEGLLLASPFGCRVFTNVFPQARFQTCGRKGGSRRVAWATIS